MLKLERQRKHLLFLLIRNLREQFYVAQQMQNVYAERNKKLKHSAERYLLRADPRLPRLWAHGPIIEKYRLRGPAYGHAGHTSMLLILQMVSEPEQIMHDS